MSKPAFFRYFDVNALAQSMQMSPAQVMIYFSDGRRAAFWFESTVAKKLGVEPVTAQGSPYDVKDLSGRKWEVRTLTQNGIFFDPSGKHGTGRAYNEADFLNKLKQITGFYVGDLTQFPQVPFYRLSAATIYAWHRSGQMKKATIQSADKVRRLILAAPTF